MLIFGFKVCPSSSNDYIKGYIITEPSDIVSVGIFLNYVFRVVAI